MFKCLKKYPKIGMIVDSAEPIHVGEMKIIKPYFGNQHWEFNEEIDDKFPEPLVEEIGMTIFLDSNHGHDEVTGKSITGLISLLGSAPVN